MENKNNSKAITDLVEKNYELIKKAEVGAIALFLIGFICSFLKVQETNFILIIGSLLTAVLFFLQAFKIVEFQGYESYNSLGSTAFTNFIFKLNFIGLSVSMISMIGFVINFERGNEMAFVGGTTLLIILILTFFSKLNEKSKVYDLKFYLRIIICLIFLVYLGITKGILN